MSRVVAGFAVSLDGFIADADDGVHSLFRWLMGGDTELVIPAGRTFRTSAASAAHYRDILDTTGAGVTGRRDFDISKAWGGVYPLDVPAFIVSHSVPQEWAGKDSPFTFVTDGVESAIEQAKAVAGDKNVALNGSQITQQALRAGLVDDLYIDLVPILLDSGVRLFGALDAPIDLEVTSVVDARGVTHLRYRVVK